MSNEPATNCHTLLQWVLVDGVARHVEEFRKYPPKQRPEAHCPQCGDPVMMKIGKVLTAHCAHWPGSVCKTQTEPESALHANAKCHLSAQLRKGASLLITKRCCRCGKRKAGAWLHEPWDEVRLEYALEYSGGTIRPDIVLFSNGQPIGALEVYVAHQVDRWKALAFREKKLPWLEIPVKDEQSAMFAWDLSHLLPYSAGTRTAWCCPACRTQARKTYWNPRYARLVDYYYPRGSWYRELWCVGEVMSPDEQQRGNHAREFLLEQVKYGSEQAPCERIPVSFSAQYRHDFDRALQEVCETRCRRWGAVYERLFERWLPIQDERHLREFFFGRHAFAPPHYTWRKECQSWQSTEQETVFLHLLERRRIRVHSFGLT